MRTEETIIDNTTDWVSKKFRYPKRKIHLATTFSGIGAIEYAFKRLGLNYEIVFAGDIDKNCKITYQSNFDIDDARWHNDVCSFSAEPYLGKVDLPSSASSRLPPG